jgi:phosphatidylinositol-3-phosphatase
MAWMPLLLGLMACMHGHAAAAMEAPAPVRHVMVIVLENEPYEVAFGEHSQAPYLAYRLPKLGALLPQYYSIGHDSLGNYIAMISGQAPNAATQSDCKIYSEFQRTASGMDGNGQVLGEGCVYPAKVKTLADQLDAARLSWKGYMEDMGADPARESSTCGHVAIGAQDHTDDASAKDQYATWHDPFVYFHSIIDDPAHCAQHVVNLDHLAQDLRSVDTTPNFIFITPNRCHDGHDAPCKSGEPGGLISADAFLRRWVPRIVAAPAFRQDGLLVITFDEGADATACCGEQGLPNGPPPGMSGAGGGRTGTVLLSPFIKPGTVSSTPYNHYSLLRTMEDIFGVSHLGYAAASPLRPFGTDVFTAAPRATTNQPVGTVTAGHDMRAQRRLTPHGP